MGYAASYDVPAVLQLTTDRTEYERGETVTFTATNLGSETLIFPGSALGIEIKNLNTGATYGVIGTAALTPMEAGESRQVAWQDAMEAETGNYSATIHTVADDGSPVLKARVNFSLT